MTPEEPRRQVTEAELVALRDDGVVCLRQIVPPRWLDRIAAGIRRSQNETTSTGELVSIPEKGFTSDLFMWMHDADLRSVVFESPLAHIAHQMLGSRTTTHWYDQIFVKEPGADVPTPWHHDLTYWPITGTQIVSFWIPLDPVTRASSGLEYVRGSHRWPNRYKAITPDHNEFMIDPALEDPPDIDADRAAYDLLDWDLQPGDLLAFHPLVVHGSSGNTSSTVRRRALASRWVGDDVVFDPRRHTMPLPPDHGLEPGDHLAGPVFPTVLTT